MCADLLIVENPAGASCTAGFSARCLLILPARCCYPRSRMRGAHI